jgi:hypothetical protein
VTFLTNQLAYDPGKWSLYKLLLFILYAILVYQGHGVYWNQFSLGLGIFLTGSVYGGLHLLAWNGPFVNPAEQVIWRGSSFVLIGGLVVPVLYFLLASIVGWTLKYSWPKRVENNLFYLLICFILAPTLFYIVARLCLVVECFINLAHLPDEVYKQPGWSHYISHFGAG